MFEVVILHFFNELCILDALELQNVTIAFFLRASLKMPNVFKSASVACGGASYGEVYLIVMVAFFPVIAVEAITGNVAFAVWSRWYLPSGNLLTFGDIRGRPVRRYFCFPQSIMFLLLAYIIYAFSRRLTQAVCGCLPS